MRSKAGEAERPARRGGSKAQGALAYARMPTVQAGAAVALAIAVGILVWLLVAGDDDSKGAKQAPARAVSVTELAELPATVRHPVYWAGPKRGFTYKLTRTKDGRIFIRYLPEGVAAGAEEPKYLTVGTYPVENGVASIRAIAKRLGTRPFSISLGGLAVQDKEHPTSVYLAYPRGAYQIEVFDPSPAVARRLVSSGRIVSVRSNAAPRGVSANGPRLSTRAELSELSSSLGHPVYWAGALPETRLELTRTPGGRIYVRYLPNGVRAGARQGHLTIGTYPVRNAVAAVERIASRPDAQRLPVTGGVAVVDPAHPTSVYLAFRGSKFEIEVFDPDARRARQLVTSGRIVPVR